MSRKSENHSADKFCNKILSRYPNAVQMADNCRRERERFGDDYRTGAICPLHW